MISVTCFHVPANTRLHGGQHRRTQANSTPTQIYPHMRTLTRTRTYTRTPPHSHANAHAHAHACAHIQ
jgi:hypothetical protein